MASTTFVDRQTPIMASWLNDANIIVYKDVLNVKTYGAIGDGSTDDTDAINAAIDAANALTTAVIYFPPGNYLVTSSLNAITTSYKTIKGSGMFSTLITSTVNGDIFSVDPSTTALYWFELSDMTLQRVAGGTYSSSCGLRVQGNVASVTGLQYANFTNLRFNNLYRGIVVEDTGKYTSGPFINNTRHGFFTFNNLVSAFATDTMYECVVFEGGTGPHHTFIGGQLRGSNAAIRLGTAGGNAGIGDIIFTGVHVVTAGVGLDIYGPTGGTTYNQNITISGCQFDGCTTATVRMDKMQNFRILPNNSTSSVGVTLTSCTNYISEDRNTVTFQNLVLNDSVDLNSSINTTGGSIADSNGTRIEQDAAFRRSVNTGFLKLIGGNVSGAGASLELFGGAHASTPEIAVVKSSVLYVQSQDGLTNVATFNESGNLTTIGPDSSATHLRINTANTTSATAGGATALPATPQGYMTINVNGTDRKVPYYGV